MNFKEAMAILTDPKVVDGEGNITEGKQDKYLEALEYARNELGIIESDELNERLAKIERLLKKHSHVNGKVMVQA